MKTIGLLGGMSWESTMTYYQLLNRGVAEKCGALHSAKILLHSFDFEQVAALQKAEAWSEAATLLGDAAIALEGAGADIVLICTNTMHLVAPRVEQRLTVPLLHIADASGEALVRAKVSKVGLLGTKFTMEHPFYRERLTDSFGLDVIVPEETPRNLVHEIIYKELCKGVIKDESRMHFREVIASLESKGAEAVLLACTEIGLLIGDGDVKPPLFDTTHLHAAAAVAFALG